MKNPYHIQTGAEWYGDVPQGWIEANRRLYDYEIVFFASGSCRVITKDKTFLCEDGSAIIIPPNFEHYSIADSRCSRWCIHFDWYGDRPANKDEWRSWMFLNEKGKFDPANCVREYPADQMTFPAYFKINAKNSLRLQELFQHFFDITPDDFGKTLQRDGIFLQILGIILSTTDKVPEREGKSSVLFLGKSILDKSFTNSAIEIRDVAAKLLITPNHFNKLFRQYLGISPKSYLLHRRLFYAESLLRNSRKNVNEIAVECGFTDASHFIRCFKKMHGVTPKVYRGDNLCSSLWKQAQNQKSKGSPQEASPQDTPVTGDDPV